jgi:membrane-bound serine protease (ClpP class)
MENLFFPLLLLALALALLLGEVFFSSGLMALLAGIVYLASVVWAFTAAGATAGLVFFLASLVGTVLTVVALVHWFPRSPLGQAFFVQPPRMDLIEAERQELHSLVGRVGRARCQMLPSGIVQIEGKSYDAISEGPGIDIGQAVEVVRVRERLLVVRSTERKPKSTSVAQQEVLPGATAETAFDSLVIDPFDEKR